MGPPVPVKVTAIKFFRDKLFEALPAKQPASQSLESLTASTQFSVPTLKL